MVKKQLIIFIAFGLLIFTNCFNNKPTQYDSTATARLVIKYQDDSLGYNQLLNGVEVHLISKNYNIQEFSGSTDTTGTVIFENLPWDQYDVEISTSFLNNMLVDTIVSLNLNENGIIEDTIYTIATDAIPGLKINEIYYTGPENRNNWFYDQYIELYNSSDEVKYLDGMIVCRIYHMLTSVTYAFRFPGEPLIGREYPVQPGEFVVLAQDAYNNTLLYSTSVDLSGADWEFVNSLDYGDYDNPNVPNLSNIITGKTVDFMINLSSNVIAIADGSDSVMTDGLDIGTVIDCVEYSSMSERTTKDIDKILDRGWAGIGNQRYSGQSVERILPGFDTNNSFNDFVIIKPPTPGYQH